MAGFGGLLAMMAFAGLPSAASAFYVLASGLFHLVYNVLLVRTYRSGDLGETYPVARGSSPALNPVGNWLISIRRKATWRQWSTMARQVPSNIFPLILI